MVPFFGTILIHRIQIRPGENTSATFDFQVAKTAPSNFGPLANYPSKSIRFSSKSGHYRQTVKSKLSNIYSKVSLKLMKYICKLCIVTKCTPTYVDEHKPSNLIKEGNWARETPECNPTKSFYTAGFHS